MLKLEKVSYMYKDSDYYAVKDINMQLGKGEHISIIGPNGCGKTTLLKSIAGLLPYQGSITVDGKQVKTMDRKIMAKKIAYMTQISNIHFPYTVYETVSQGRYAYLKGVFSKLSKEDEQGINEALEMVGMQNFKNSKITELSGGQLQRVFLARTFAQKPDIILLDEPTNHLDLKNQIELLEHLKEWVSVGEKSVISVLHDLNLVQMYSDRVVLMEFGKIYATGQKQQVLTGEILKKVYSHDISSWMKEALEKWTV